MNKDNTLETKHKYNPELTETKEKILKYLKNPPNTKTYRQIGEDWLLASQVRKDLKIPRTSFYKAIVILKTENKIDKIGEERHFKIRLNKFKVKEITKTIFKSQREGLTKEQIALYREAFQHRLRTTEKIGMEIINYIYKWYWNIHDKWLVKKPKTLLFASGLKEEEFFAIPLVDFCERYKIDIENMKEKIRLRTGYRKDNPYFEDRFASFLANLKVIDSEEYVNSQIRRIMKEKNIGVFEAFMNFATDNENGRWLIQKPDGSYSFISDLDLNSKNKLKPNI